jgi:4-hydroxy-tetrahydrodipicolinate synthase
MSYTADKESLKGVGFTTPTPFSDDRRDVQHDELAENVQFLIDSGGKLFIPCGNTGEYDALTHSERHEVVRTVVETVGDEGYVVGGVSGSLKTVLDLVAEYERAGADAVMVMEPSHTYVHYEGLREYYEAVADATDLGVVLYKRTHDVPDDLVLDIVELENVVGVKYAVNDIKSFSHAVDESVADVVWINGIAERFSVSFTLEGAKGFTTGIGNFVPEAVMELMEAIEREEWELAKSIRNLLRPYEDLREEAGTDNERIAANNVPAVKYGMELADLNGGPVRPPIIELSDRDKQRAREFYDRITSRTGSPSNESAS